MQKEGCMTKVVFVHGWGYNPHLWRAMAAQMYGIEPIYVDLGFIDGYEGPKIDAVPSGAIVVGHSLGALWLLRQRSDYKGFVSLAGFDCFHAHVPPSEMEQMHNHLARNAPAQMHGFWQASGTYDFCGSEQINVPNLQKGLDWLANWDARSALKSLSCPVRALASKTDAIVSKEMSASIWKDKDLRWIEAGGHCLPMTLPAWCAREIEGFVHALERA
jgi:pimeloyl-[acyl-carrier protein] methyl ester esterase